MKKQDEEKLIKKILKELGCRPEEDYFALDNFENNPNLEIEDISDEEFEKILSISIENPEILLIDLILNHINCKAYLEIEGKKITCLDFILDKLECKN